MKKIPKKNLLLKEDSATEKTYAASTDGQNSTPQEIKAKTQQQHPDATAVEVPGKEIDGNTSTQVSTMEINDDPQSLANAQKMARTFQSQGQDVNFKIKLHNSVQRQGKLVEGVTFTKGELTEFLRSL